MSTLDFAALAGAAVISVSFALARFAEAAFVLPSLAVIAAAGALAVSAPAPPAEGVLLVAGLGLYVFGLAVVRVMIHRSVSLRMLSTYDRGGAGDGGCEDIRGRLGDTERYHLASRRDGVYALTPFGRTVAGTVAVLYRVTSVEA
jgi:hypothetical protein